MKENDKKHFEFLEYFNCKYKGVTLEEIAFLAKQGEKEAEEEYFWRIQNVLSALSDIYSNSTNIPAEDYLDEFYLAAKKAIVTYRPEQGEFVRFLRSYLANAAKWYVARYTRMRKNRPTIYSYDSLNEQTPLDIQYSLADPDSPTPMSIADKLDNEIYYEYAIEFISKYLKSRDKELIDLYIVQGCNPRKIASEMNLSFSGVYRHLKTLFSNMNDYIKMREKRASLEITLKNDSESKQEK